MFFFTTAKERKKKEKLYFKKIYPLGKEQKEWEKSLIEQLFSQEKNTELILFNLITLKEKIYNATHNVDEEDVETVINKWKQDIKDEKILAKAEVLIKLALAQQDIKKLEDLPDINNIIYKE